MELDPVAAHALTLDLYGQLRNAIDANKAAADRIAELEQRVEQLTAHSTELTGFLALFEGVEAPGGH